MRLGGQSPEIEIRIIVLLGGIDEYHWRSRWRNHWRRMSLAESNNCHARISRTIEMRTIEMGTATIKMRCWKLSIHVNRRLRFEPPSI